MDHTLGGVPGRQPDSHAADRTTGPRTRAGTSSHGGVDAPGVSTLPNGPALRSTATPLLHSAAARALREGRLKSADLIGTICNMPGVPPVVAEEMALTLLGGSPDFTRDSLGRWSLVLTPASPNNIALVAADTPLNTISYLVVDTETTGFHAAGADRITEIAAYAASSDGIELVIDTLVNPARPIPRYITRLTGISHEMVKDAPSFSEISAQLSAALDGRVFTAHNARFDWNFLFWEMLRATGASITQAQLCTVKMSRKLLPGLARRSLDSVTQYFDIEIEGRHRAGGDALATAKVLRKLLERAVDSGIGTWGELQETLLRPPATRGRKGRGKKGGRRRRQ